MEVRALNRIALVLIPLCLGIVMAGVYVGFIASGTFSVQAQVVAHISTFFASVAFTMSYILHLNTREPLANSKLTGAHADAARPMNCASENHVHECCLTGMHRL